MRTRLKICGLTREQDVDAAVEAGADAIGFIFYPKSKRYVEPALAARLRRRAPAFVDVVALTVNASDTDMTRIVGEVEPDLLQFHGDETPEQCVKPGKRFLRAFRIGSAGLQDEAQIAATCATYSDACAWLFDSDSAGYGGSGHGFDHRYFSFMREQPVTRALILSGGLKADTIEERIRSLRPWAVDVSSGVEIEPGIKSAEKIRAFAQAVRRADA